MPQSIQSMSAYPWKITFRLGTVTDISFHRTRKSALADGEQYVGKGYTVQLFKYEHGAYVERRIPNNDLVRIAEERQDDVRRELLHFTRFVESFDYYLAPRGLGHNSRRAGNWEELVDLFLQADQKDWFAEALKSGNAQDGGKG